MSDEQNRAQEILAPYRNTISETPRLLSLLYDADMLPEQAVTIRGAISTVAVVVAYKDGLAQRDAALKAADELAKSAKKQKDRFLSYVRKPDAKKAMRSLDADDDFDAALEDYLKARGQDAD